MQVLLSDCEWPLAGFNVDEDVAMDVGKTIDPNQLPKLPHEIPEESYDISVRIKRVRINGLALPKYQSNGAAAIDLAADLSIWFDRTRDLFVLKRGERATIDTGFSFEIPRGYEGQMRPRSGMAIHNGITLINSPGTIDCDYRGEVRILLINLGNHDLTIEHGDRLAQLLFTPVMHARFIEVSELSDTSRGDGGYGSTGVKR